MFNLKTNLVIGLSLIALSACSNSAKTEAPTQSLDAVHLPSLPQITKSPAMPLRGIITKQAEAYTFRPCDSEQTLSLVTDANDLQRLSKFTQSNSTYAEFYGQIYPHLEPSDNFAKVSPTNWQRIRHEGGSCQKPEANFSAYGNEPAWQVQVTGQYLQIRANGITFKEKINREVNLSQQHHWASENISLKLSPEACFDTMAGDFFAYKAVLDYQDQSFHGCAQQNLPASLSSHELAGFYQIPSSRINQNSQVVALSLNEDFSAQLIHDSSTMEQPVVESGFWYPTRPNQLRFEHSTAHIDKPALEFRWNGQKLNQISSESAEAIRFHKMDGSYISEGKGAGNNYSQRKLTGETLVASSQADPVVNAVLHNYFVLHRSNPQGARYLWWRYDLNGDGQEEIITYLNSCNSQGCPMIIFEPTATGYQFLTRINGVAQEFSLGNSSFAQWQDIIIPNRHGGKASRLRFDGLSYPSFTQGQPLVQSQSEYGSVKFVLPELTGRWGVLLN